MRLRLSLPRPVCPTVPSLPHRLPTHPADFVQGMSNSTTMDPSALTQVPIGEVASLARFDGVLGAMAWGGAAGAMQATPADMVKWWHTFLFQPEVGGSCCVACG